MTNHRAFIIFILLVAASMKIWTGMIVVNKSRQGFTAAILAMVTSTILIFTYSQYVTFLEPSVITSSIYFSPTANGKDIRCLSLAQVEIKDPTRGFENLSAGCQRNI